MFRKHKKTVSKQARNRVFATFIFHGSYAVVKNGSFLPKPQNVINFLDFCFYCLVYSRVGVKYSTCTWYLYLSTYLSVLDVLEYLMYGNVKVLVLVLVLDQKVLGTYK